MYPLAGQDRSSGVSPAPLLPGLGDMGLKAGSLSQGPAGCLISGPAPHCTRWDGPSRLIMPSAASRHPGDPGGSHSQATPTSVSGFGRVHGTPPVPVTKEGGVLEAAGGSQGPGSAVGEAGAAPSPCPGRGSTGPEVPKAGCTEGKRPKRHVWAPGCRAPSGQTWHGDRQPCRAWCVGRGSTCVTRTGPGLSCTLQPHQSPEKVPRPREAAEVGQLRTGQLSPTPVRPHDTSPCAPSAAMRTDTGLGTAATCR